MCGAPAKRHLRLNFDLASRYNYYYMGYSHETSTHINTRTLHSPLSLPALYESRDRRLGGKRDE